MAGGPPFLSNLLHHSQAPAQRRPSVGGSHGIGALRPGSIDNGLSPVTAGALPGSESTLSSGNLDWSSAGSNGSHPRTTTSAASATSLAGTTKQIASADSSSGTPGLYQCAHCQKRYSRPEHLARHIQTHTLGKRFICHICSKAFARQDLLKRHTANHENDNDPTKKRRRITTSPGSARVSHACKGCAAARVKCEDSKPCTRCRNRGMTCEYDPAEGGSAADMHLLHVAANTRSGSLSPGMPPPAQVSPGVQPQVTQGPASVQAALPIKANEDLRGFGAGVMPDISNPPVVPPAFATDGSVMDPASVPFSGFLQSIMYQPGMEPQSTDESQGLAVLDLGVHSNLDLNDIDFDLLGYWNADVATDSNSMVQTFTPKSDDSMDLTEMRQNLVKVWTDSPWRWHPATSDGSYTEMRNLPVSSSDDTTTLRERRKRLGRTVPDKLEPAARDGAMAVVLKTCDAPEMMARVASSFPSVEMMDSLIHIFLASHFCQTPPYVHPATFNLNTRWPDWVAIAAASGAILTPVPTLRKWGFAIQEAVRLILPTRFNQSNATIKERDLVESLILWLDMALWSGSRRKMEIAESHLGIPFTMLRYRNRFQRSSYPQVDVDPSDEGQSLEKKWKTWSERESWKRLSFHCLIRDAQASMATLIPMSSSYAEMTLPLPEGRDLWFAQTAEEWKKHYLEKVAVRSKRPPSLGDLLRDINLLATNQAQLDVQSAISIYLHGFWALIREYQQLCSVLRSRSWMVPSGSTGDQLLRSRHGELCSELHTFQRLVSDWGPELISGKEHLVTHLILMNLHLSLDDLQLFSGKEGEEQARRVFPNLRDWAQSSEGRQALWHAGQVLRQAKLFPPGHLKDFYAVAVHHAALAIWAYGVVTKAAGKPPAHMMGHETVYLDGTVSGALNHFIGYGQGNAMIQDLPGLPGPRDASVDDTKACMDVAQRILRANFRGRKDLPPPIVENMCGLLKQLGEAARAVGLG